MSAAEYGIQRAIYAALTSDPALAALLAADVTEVGSPALPGVYDHVPQPEHAEDDSVYPYVVIGEHTGVPFDTDDVNGQETTIVLHIWDRRAGRLRAKQVVGAIYAVLHDKPLVVDGVSCVFCFWEFGESVPDPDDKIQHEVTRYRILTQAS